MALGTSLLSRVACGELVAPRLKYASHSRGAATRAFVCKSEEEDGGNLTDFGNGGDQGVALVEKAAQPDRCETPE